MSFIWRSTNASRNSEGVLGGEENMEMPDRKLIELIHRLQAQNAALIAILKETPAGDGQPIVNFERWERYEKFMDSELKKYNLE